jgi:putative hydrolase of the HAD superfamily
MKRSTEIGALFLDIGGALLKEGWSHRSRRLAVRALGVNPQQLEKWHHLTFETHQEGKHRLQEYLVRVFYNTSKNVVRNKSMVLN